MHTIMKRSGKEEAFESNKILESMRNAGVSQKAAEGIADVIGHHEGITTREVRNRILGGIKNREPQAAERYEKYPRRSHGA